MEDRDVWEHFEKNNSLTYETVEHETNTNTTTVTKVQLS
jgi:hypothetical protein